ncbi:MAG: hypothetical protein J6I49_06830 [Bacteroidales bacterium]|nr:hypothetical protein [Bacteroidales bacterium]
MIVECFGLRPCGANAGLEGSVVVNEVKNDKADYGYNARTEKYECYGCRT